MKHKKEKLQVFAHLKKGDCAELARQLEYGRYYVSKVLNGSAENPYIWNAAYHLSDIRKKEGEAVAAKIAKGNEDGEKL